MREVGRERAESMRVGRGPDGRRARDVFLGGFGERQSQLGLRSGGRGRWFPRFADAGLIGRRIGYLTRIGPGPPGKGHIQPNPLWSFSADRAEVSGLRGQWNGPRAAESQAQSSQHYEIGVKPDALQSTDAERRKRIVVLEVAELPFHRTTVAIE